MVLDHIVRLEVTRSIRKYIDCIVNTGIITKRPLDCSIESHKLFVTVDTARNEYIWHRGQYIKLNLHINQNFNH